jgi:exosortase A
VALISLSAARRFGVKREFMPASRKWLLLVPVVAALWLYRDVLLGLVNDWSNDDNYSHGFLIVPLAAFFAWERRERFWSAPVAPSAWGLVLVLASLGLLVAGLLGAEFFVSRVSILGVLGGAIWFLWGWARLRVLLFPLTFLVLMIPIPAILFNQIAFPLQLFASRFGVAVMQMADVPVLREGNVITLATTQLEVAEACSGIRSLISLLTLGIVYGYFTESRPWARAVIALATIPIAIVANGLRVAGTGILAHTHGPEAALGFFHTFSGWLVFLAAFVFLFGVVWLLRRVVPPSAPELAAAEAK